MCTMTVTQAGFPVFFWSSEGVGREDWAELAVKNMFASSGKVIRVSTELVPANFSYLDTGEVPGS